MIKDEGLRELIEQRKALTAKIAAKKPGDDVMALLTKEKELFDKIKEHPEFSGTIDTAYEVWLS